MTNGNRASIAQGYSVVYLLFGDEDYLIHEELERIKAGLGPRTWWG